VALCSHGRSGDLTVYIAVNGGKGQYGDLLFATVARFLKARLVLHHHTFEYLTNPRLRSRFLAWCAGSTAVHVVLCGRMAEVLRNVYPSVKRTIVMSNAALTPTPARMIRKDRPLQAVGFIGSVTHEKGIDRFLALLNQLHARGSRVQGHVAGPCSD